MKIFKKNIFLTFYSINRFQKLLGILSANDIEDISNIQLLRAAKDRLFKFHGIFLEFLLKIQIVGKIVI